ncbi:MAG: hypothetical protein QM644_02635 [Mobilitalea sp.]
MCCEYNINTMQISKQRQWIIRTTALTMCICFLLASLLSATFIMTYGIHEHDHDGPNGRCATCINITSAENIVKQLSAAIISISFIFGSLYSILSLLKSISFSIGFFTLVKLKVRMNH